MCTQAHDGCTSTHTQCLLLEQVVFPIVKNCTCVLQKKHVGMKNEVIALHFMNHINP